MMYGSFAGIGLMNFPLATNNIQLTDEELLILLASVGLVVVGTFFWYAAVREPIKRAGLLFQAEPFDPSRSTERGTPVAVNGTVRQAEKTLTAPFSDEECVTYEHKDQQYDYTYRYDYDRRRRMRQRDDDDWNDRIWSWETVDRRTDRVPFYVDTGAGTVAVDPDGASIESPIEKEEKTGRIRRHLYKLNPLTGTESANGILSVIGNVLALLPFADSLKPTRPQRQVVTHLDPGEEVLVVGGVDEDPNDGTLAGRIDKGNEVGIFKITTVSLFRLRLRAIWNLLSGSVPGLIAVTIGIGIALIAVVG